MDIIANKKDGLIKTIIHSVQGVSFGSAQKMLRKGDVKVNGKRVKQNIDVEKGDTISIYTPATKPMPKVDIIYEDENILIVNKPAGIECATRDKSSENTYSLEEIFASHGAIVVHRLDRLTEGLVLLAKSKENAIKFEKIFRGKEIDKSYKALTLGHPKVSGEIKAYLYKDSKNSQVTISDTPQDGYKEIITIFNILEDKGNYSLVDINLKTGRTHQIRAQLAHLGTPILNDSKYGLPLKNSPHKGYFLTAYKLSFNISDLSLKYLNEKSFEITPSWIVFEW